MRPNSVWQILRVEQPPGDSHLGVRRDSGLTKCDYYSPVALPFSDTLRSKAKPTLTILLVNPTSRNAKELICRKRFGIRGLFAFSGSSNAGPVPCATPGSPGSLVGVFIITSPVPWVVPRVQKTASCSIQSAPTGFIANTFPYRNRVSLKEAFEGPEPHAGKLSRPVLRGLAPSNGGRLLAEGCYDSQRLRRTIAMLSRLAIGRETNILVVGLFETPFAASTLDVTNSATSP